MTQINLKSNVDAFLEIEKRVIQKSQNAPHLGGRVVYHTIEKLSFFAVSLAASAVAVSTAVYVCFLKLQSLFHSVDEQFIGIHEKNCIDAFRVSVLSLMGIFFQSEVAKMIDSYGKNKFFTTDKSSKPDVNLENRRPVPPLELERIRSNKLPLEVDKSSVSAESTDDSSSDVSAESEFSLKYEGRPMEFLNSMELCRVKARSLDENEILRLIRGEQVRAKEQLDQQPTMYVYEEPVRCVPDSDQSWSVISQELGDISISRCHYKPASTKFRSEQVVGSFHLLCSERSIPIQVMGLIENIGGSCAATFLQGKLLETLQSEFSRSLRSELTHQAIWKGIVDAFINLNIEFVQQYQAVIDTDSRQFISNQGATLCVAIVLDQHLWIANLGRSTAFITLNDEPVALSVETDPSLPFFKEKIEGRGGFVRDGLVLYKDQKTGSPTAHGIGFQHLSGAVSPLPRISCYSLKRLGNVRLFLSSQSLNQCYNSKSLSDSFLDAEKKNWSLEKKALHCVFNATLGRTDTDFSLLSADFRTVLRVEERVETPSPVMIPSRSEMVKTLLDRWRNKGSPSFIEDGQSVNGEKEQPLSPISPLPSDLERGSPALSEAMSSPVQISPLPSDLERGSPALSDWVDEALKLPKAEDATPLSPPKSDSLSDSDDPQFEVAKVKTSNSKPTTIITSKEENREVDGREDDSSSDSSGVFVTFGRDDSPDVLSISGNGLSFGRKSSPESPELSGDEF